MMLAGGSFCEAADAEEPRVAWKPEWRRFDWIEGVATAGLITASFVEDKYLDGQSAPRWTGAFLFDNQFRAVFRGRSDHAQQVATKYADIGYATLSFFPYFDVAIAFGVHRSPDVALQMFLIDAQSFGVTASVTTFTKWIVARQRPYARGCAPGDTVGIHGCGTSYDNTGFFSGHTSASFTGAALTCVHHQHLPLYGSALADGWACAWAITGATATAAMRMVSDDHYLSDVLAGAALGILSGYVLPSALHYGFGRKTKAAIGGAMQMVPTLMPVEGGLGFGVAGLL